MVLQIELILQLACIHLTSHLENSTTMAIDPIILVQSIVMGIKEVPNKREIPVAPNRQSVLYN